MSKTKATQAADLYSTARENPYVQRLIEDEELRDSLKKAFEAGRGRLRPSDQQRWHRQGGHRRQEGAARPQDRGGEPARRLRGAAGAEEAQEEPARPDRHARPGRRRRRPDPQRGRPQDRARRPLRRRGGVRVHTTTRLTAPESAVRRAHRPPPRLHRLNPWRRRQQNGSSAARRRSGSSMRCGSASPSAARRARPSSTSPARPA